MSKISMPNGITKGRAMPCCSLGVQPPAATGMFNAASDWAACCVITIRRQRNGVPENGAQTETKSGNRLPPSRKLPWQPYYELQVCSDPTESLTMVAADTLKRAKAGE